MRRRLEKFYPNFTNLHIYIIKTTKNFEKLDLVAMIINELCILENLTLLRLEPIFDVTTTCSTSI